MNYAELDFLKYLAEVFAVAVTHVETCLCRTNGSPIGSCKSL
jgi:hypothetical protein